MRAATKHIGNWLVEDLHPNCLATVTFKQCKHHGQGRIEWINQNIAEETCNELMMRCVKTLNRNGTSLNRNALHWGTFIENGNGSKRLHAHIAINVADGISVEDFGDAFRALCMRFDWVDGRIEVQKLMNETDDRRVIFYCLKEGIDAFRPNASHLVPN